jgi:hypothetical protein
VRRGRKGPGRRRGLSASNTVWRKERLKVEVGSDRCAHGMVLKEWMNEWTDASYYCCGRKKNGSWRRRGVGSCTLYLFDTVLHAVESTMRVHLTLRTQYLVIENWFEFDVSSAGMNGWIEGRDWTTKTRKERQRFCLARLRDVTLSDLISG